MPLPDAAAMLPLLVQWRHQHDAIEAVLGALAGAVGRVPETPLFDALWGTFDAYTSVLAERLGDDRNWLRWYAEDCRMGGQPHTAYLGARAIQVVALEDLARFLVDWREWADRPPATAPEQQPA